MKKLPLDISTFSRMIRENYIYVDKTQFIYDLFKGGQRYFFLSRPRRFGKSLLISTLKEIFLGNKELFKDLWLGNQKDFNWQKHPVIHLDFSNADTETATEFKISLGHMLDDVASQYKIDLSKRTTPKAKLTQLVTTLAQKNLVVILIDEYDKPILDHISNPKRADAQRIALKNFYDGFKGLDAYMRAIFITGVSKFSKTSIFSGLNNLNELSNDPKAAQLLGYTESELSIYFTEYLNQAAKDLHLRSDLLLEKIRYWYNGYQFSAKPIKVYNPYSIAHFCERKQFNNYWFETGTPSFLVELLKHNPDELKNIEQKAFTASTLGTFSIDQIPLITLLYQTGYITIREYDASYNVFKMDYPNEEVKQSLSVLEMGVLTNSKMPHLENILYQLKLALDHKDIDSFVKLLQGLFASIPYNLHIDREAYYHSLIKLLCNLLSVENHCELSMSSGKVDLVLIRPKYVYCIEFKFNKPAEEALKQIKEKRYYEPFLSLKKEIVLVGISFNFKNKILRLDYKSTSKEI